MMTKILSFMSEYLLKICQLIEHERVCECIKKKLAELEDQQYKIAFLRE
jgi:hypothetical protein